MRNEKIDLLRFIGISSIILAHVVPPTFISQLRNFDVPLMVLLSGFVFALSKKAKFSYRDYLISRVIRLYLPVFFFLTLLFFVVYPFVFLLNGTYPVSIKKIIDSYCLIEGIGFVWIIRVFLLVALVAPLIQTINHRIKSNVHYFLGVLSLFLIDLLAVKITDTQNSFIYHFTNLIFFYLLPYGCIFALGLRLHVLSRKDILRMAIVSLAVFTILFLHPLFSEGKLVLTQEYKYPPQLYYLSYAIGISLLIYSFSDCLFNFVKKVRLRAITTFIGQNSMWIYLWHIPFVQLIKQSGVLQPPNFLLRYGIVYICAFVLAYAQIHLVKKFVEYQNIEAKRRKLILSILTG